ncbi:MAG TPA: M48 family metalloprotease [Blastocatellia bacterium]|nr:M48 family metalloprotease [Blastocatellia bacterium]
MLKQIMLAAIFALGLPIIIAGQTKKSDETERAIARLGDLATEAVRRHLSELRPPSYQPGQFLLNEIIKRKELTVISGGVERLKAALQPALAYHERDGKLPIYLVRSEQPKAYVAERAALIITTKLTLIASEAELRGIVAHELAHEYFWEERDQAFKEKDESLLREIELFCDAVAAITLKEIGDDPACYARALERMTYIGITAGNVTRSKTKTHPSLDERVKLNRWICKQLSQITTTAASEAHLYQHNFLRQCFRGSAARCAEDRRPIGAEFGAGLNHHGFLPAAQFVTIVSGAFGSASTTTLIRNRCPSAVTA